MMAFFKWLINFRKSHPAIWLGERETLHVDGETSTYGYKISNENEIILVCLNLGDVDTTIHIKDDISKIEHTFHLKKWSGDILVPSELD